MPPRRSAASSSPAPTPVPDRCGSWLAMRTRRRGPSSATRRPRQPSRRRARQINVDKAMTSQLKSPSCQSGAYLLEALIGILIFALGVLGIVGLQAASLRTTTDSSLRAEAVFAANQLMGQMWADVQGSLVANYSSASAGATYTSWAAELKSAQGG